MDSGDTWESRLENIKQAFLNGEFSYDGTIQKLCACRMYYSIRSAKNRVDSWKAEMRNPVYVESKKRLPRINENVP
ncbi:MAG: hypothetical protein FWB78_05370 [Treponema sp.]|nr:hypothetical protein [Treponema sp.]MCL2192805.1 hypothetical protein [Treponema sp.]